LANQLIIDQDLDAIESGSSAATDQMSIPPAFGLTRDTTDLDATASLPSASSSGPNHNLDSEEAKVIRSSILEAVQEIGDDSSESVADDVVRPKTSPTVEVPGKGLVYKMHLITELNTNPEHLSLDRLRRVHARSQESVASGLPSPDEQMAGLFDDIALELVSQDEKSMWYLARIQKVFKVTLGGARIDYQRPVSIA
jgi:hypothetical protein